MVWSMIDIPFYDTVNSQYVNYLEKIKVCVVKNYGKRLLILICHHTSYHTSRIIRVARQIDLWPWYICLSTKEPYLYLNESMLGKPTDKIRCRCNWLYTKIDEQKDAVSFYLDTILKLEKTLCSMTLDLGRKVLEIIILVQISMNVIYLFAG